MRPCKLYAAVLIGTLLAWGAGCQSEHAGSDPINPRAGSFLTQAQRAFQQGSYRQALALTDSARHYAPELPQLHFIRGRVFSVLQRFDEAEAAYQAVLSVDPEHEGVWFNLGNNALRRGQQRQALSYYRRELSLHPSSKAHLYMGRAYAEMGQTDSARQAFQKSIAADSSNAIAYAYLGQLHKNEGELTQALAYSRKALQHDTDNVDYRYVVGSQLLQTGQPAEAVGKLETVVDERPWHYGALYNLGQALVRLDREDKAEPYFAKADSAQRLQAHIDQLKETARLNPDRLEPWVNLGNILYRAGRLEEAKQVFDSALFLAPENLALQNNIANLAHDLGNRAEAIQRYQAILKRNPALADVWVNLGIVYIDDEQPEAARRAWETALEHAPGHPAARQYLATLQDAP